MWFPVAWLSLGFALKWIREAFEKFNKKWGEDMFDILLLILTFALIITLVGFMHVDGMILFLCFAMWSLACLMIKAK